MSDSSVVLLCSDLMMTSSVGGAASAAGRAFRTVGDVAALSSCGDDDLILIDLATPGLDLEQAAVALSDRQKQAAIVYGPHVHVARFEAARAAGFPTVIARGQFAANVQMLVSSVPHAE